ncbi:helix-turn-helix domain-containing protein (plasmid) [Edwardsiella tarda]
MINESSRKLTNFTSVLLLLIKECRLERGVHQAQLAEKINKSPSSFAKIETGKSPLTMEVFLACCSSLMISPSAVMATAERYGNLLTNNGWTLLNSSLEEKDDKLLMESQEYYSSPGYKARLNTLSALNGPFYYPNGNVNGLAVFLFSISDTFKNQQLTCSPHLLQGWS